MYRKKFSLGVLSNFDKKLYKLNITLLQKVIISNKVIRRKTVTHCLIAPDFETFCEYFTCILENVTDIVSDIIFNKKFSLFTRTKNFSPSNCLLFLKKSGKAFFGCENYLRPPLRFFSSSSSWLSSAPAASSSSSPSSPPLFLPSSTSPSSSLRSQNRIGGHVGAEKEERMKIKQEEKKGQS